MGRTTEKDLEKQQGKRIMGDEDGKLRKKQYGCQEAFLKTVGGYKWELKTEYLV